MLPASVPEETMNGIMTRPRCLTRFWPEIFTAVLMILPIQANADTIVSVTGPNKVAIGLISQDLCNSNPTTFCPPEILESEWSQTATYNNVAITVQFALYGNSLSATAYLMTQIGPSSTPAQQLASA